MTYQKHNEIKCTDDGCRRPPGRIASFVIRINGNCYHWLCLTHLKSSEYKHFNREDILPIIYV